MKKKVIAGTLVVGCAAPLALVAGGGVLAIGMFAGGYGDNSAICSDSSVSVTIDGDMPEPVGSYSPEAMERAAVARRHGAEELAIRTVEKRRDAAQREVSEVDERLESSRAQLGRMEHHLSGLAEEIETRTVMDPEMARAEQHAREHAAIYEPAKPTDRLRRPFGLATSLSQEQARIRAEREEARTVIARASAEPNSAGAHTADMQREAEQAARALREQLDAATDAATREHAEQARAGLAQLQADRQAAATAGVLRRRSAQRTAAESAERFIRAHGPVPEPGEAEAWVQATAAEGAHRELSRTDLPARAAAAQKQATTAREQAQRAERAETKLASSIHTARLDLRDLDAQDSELHHEATVRREMPSDPATRENRLRHARARNSAPAPDRAPAQPRVEDDAEQRPSQPPRGSERAQERLRRQASTTDSRSRPRPAGTGMTASVSAAEHVLDQQRGHPYPGREHAQQGDQQRRRQDAAGPLGVERAEAAPPLPLERLQQMRGDQEAQDHEEDVHAHEPAGERRDPAVVEHHRDRPQALDVGAEAEPRPRGVSCVAQGHCGRDRGVSRDRLTPAR